ncbi:uncharacterized protein [Chironomus tepperi]|uniref:uncharacterized protein n=1 Tax=Chironomus tepperi TaxID=113505 RepID=UPI00391F41DD
MLFKKKKKSSKKAHIDRVSMHVISPYKLSESMCRETTKQHQIYCVKFCPYTDEYIFAAAILNKVEIFKINDGDSMTKMRTFEAKKEEYFYALSWTINKKTDEIVLIGGGMGGKIYNFIETSIFGVTMREKQNAINDIVFSPKIEYLFAAAYEDGSVCLYNLITESCIAICQTQRSDSMKQCISISFDPSGNYLAYGGMTNEIFIVNLKDCKDFQDNLKQSMTIKNKIDPVKLNLLHNMCVVQNLHTNFIDSINWYAENSFISKSADGDIIFWELKGIDGQVIPFKNVNGLKIVEQHISVIENCNLWFIRFSLDPKLEYLTIGTCNGELYVCDLRNDSLFNCEYHILSNTFSQAAIRQSSFSNDGKYVVCSTDDSFLISYKRFDALDNNNNDIRVVKKKSKKSKKKTRK